MADLTEVDFLSRLGTPTSAQAIGPPAPEPIGPPAPDGLLPLAAAASNRVARTPEDFARRAGRTPNSPSQEPDIATKLGARPGIPFDTETGAPTSVRYELGRRRDPAMQLDYLKKFYGDNSVRQNMMGDWVVTAFENGQKKDMLVNPLGADWKDLAELSAH